MHGDELVLVSLLRTVVVGSLRLEIESGLSSVLRAGKHHSHVLSDSVALMNLLLVLPTLNICERLFSKP